jgi:acetyltransferase-like isoleucine patch superfamily enzyme
MGKKITFYFYKLLSKIKRNGNETMNDYYRKSGAKIGKNALICTDISGDEAFLIEIGDNTTISIDVCFLTHDYSIHNLNPELINLFGKITIGRNCFVGARSILMYGVTLADNIIVAAGSVVTKSFTESNVIIGGNPARVIGTWDTLYQKVKEKSLSRHNLEKTIKEHPEKLILR